MEFRVLGPLVVRDDGGEVLIGAAKQRALLALLLLRRGELVPTDALVVGLWGERPPATAVKTVQVYISQLRKQLGDGLIETRPGGYVLHTDPDVVDAVRFDRLVAQGRDLLAAGDAGAAGERLSEALALWRGPPLAEFQYESFARDAIRRLEELHLIGLELRFESELALGRHAEAVPELEALIREHPLRENLRRLLMLALYRSGRQADALNAYRDTRTALREELGLDPSDSLQTLEKAILTHDPALDRPAPLPSAPIQVRPAALATDEQPPARDSPTETPTTRTRRRAVLAAVTGAVIAASVAIAAVLGFRSAPVGPSVVSADSVGMFHAGGGHLTGQIPLGVSPSAITTGDDSVWIANIDDHSVSRIDPVKETIIDTIPVGNDPDGIAYGDRFVWVTNGLDGTVTQIDPVTNTPVNTINVGNGPAGVAVGSRYVWVANSYDGTVTRIDPRTDQTLPAISVGQGADGIAIGFHSVWVTSPATGTVTRIDEGTGDVIQPIHSGSGAGAVAAGPDSVWVANELDGTVSRINPASNGVRGTIGVGDGPNGIVVSDGAVWVSNEASGSISRIDPQRNVAGQPVRIGNEPEGLALLGGTLYAAVGASGTGHRGGTLTVLTYAGNVSSLDPALVFNPEEAALSNLTSDGLVGYAKVAGSAGYVLVPDLAVSIPPSTDGGLTYTFQVRRHIRYSNGALLRPQDFRTGLERYVTLNGRPPPGTFPPIVGLQGCFERPKRLCDLSRGIVTDDATGTVTYHLTSPDPDFYYQAPYPVPPGTPFRPESVVPGTGPYRVATFNTHEIRLVRNRFFREWSRLAQPSGNPNVIVERFGGTADARVRSVLRGSADLATGFVGAPSPALLQSLRTQHLSQLKQNPSSAPGSSRSTRASRPSTTWTRDER